MGANVDAGELVDA